MGIERKKLFYIFLFINAICWSCIQLLRNVVSIDAMEAVCWGELLDFGTNKHPPLSGWLAGFFYNIFGGHDFILYILGQACLLVGFIYIYKLAKFFLSEEKAMCASMIMTSCYYYTYIVFIDNFNCNFLSMALWPMITYYFYKSSKENKTKDWLIFGVVSALGVLCKYQVIFLFFALFLYLIFCDRKQFRQKGMYLSILAGSLLILPHILYLYKTDFFSFIYMAGRTDLGSHNTPEFLLPFGRIVFPLKFFIDQVLSVTTCIVVYLFLWLQTKNIEVNKNLKNKESIFILLLTFAPILMQSCMAAVENNRIMGIWGSMMVAYVGIFLFYFFPIKFNEKTFNYFLKWAYALMAAWLAAMFIFSQLQVKRTLSYPYQKIMPEINKVWDAQTNKAELKYVYGHIDYVFQFHTYNERRPKVILETFGHKNPWIDFEDVSKSGVLVVGKNKKNLDFYVKEITKSLSGNYRVSPVKHEFKVVNKLGRIKKYSFCYTIISDTD